jgi:hypothetical protein
MTTTILLIMSAVLVLAAIVIRICQVGADYDAALEE